MDYTINRPSADVLVLTVHGSSILTFSDDFRRTPETSTESHITLDCASVGHLSSSALGQLLGFARRLKIQGRSLAVINLSPSIVQVLKAARLDLIISVRGSESVSPKRYAGTTIEGDGPINSIPLPTVENSTGEASMPQYPTITDDDRRFAADWKFAQEQLAMGAFEPWAGKFLGIFNRKVVVMGDREADIRREFEASSGISGSQLAVLWIDNDEV